MIFYRKKVAKLRRIENNRFISVPEIKFALLLETWLEFFSNLKATEKGWIAIEKDKKETFDEKNGFFQMKRLPKLIQIYSMLNSMVHWTRASRFAALDPALNNLD